MLNRTLGEKKLLALINATVSHEMRNPINSIRSQILQQKMLNQKIIDLLNSNLKPKKLKKKIRAIIDEKN